MEVEKLIERLRNAAGGPEGIKMCQDAATALSTLQAENEKLKQKFERYTAAARVIALYLDEFCDRSLPYDEMIAEAARRADFCPNCGARMDKEYGQ